MFDSPRSARRTRRTENRIKKATGFQHDLLFLRVLRTTMSANLRGLGKFFRTRIFSRQDAKAQSSENVSFLRVFAPLREIIPALVAALPLWVLRDDIPGLFG